MATSKTVIVTNISPSLSEAHIRDLFGTCGTITSCVLEDGGHSTAKCTITFATDDEMKVALLLDEVNLAGSPLKVEQVGSSPPEDVPQFLSKHRANELAKTVYVGNLPPGIDEKGVTHLFAAVGSVVYVKMGDPSSQSSYAFVEFESIASAQKAKNMHGIMMGGRSVKVGDAQTPIARSGTVSGISEKRVAVSRLSFRDKEDIRRRIASLQNRLRERYGFRSRGRRSVSRSPRKKHVVVQKQKPSREGMFWDGKFNGIDLICRFSMDCKEINYLPSNQLVTTPPEISIGHRSGLSKGFSIISFVIENASCEDSRGPSMITSS